MGWILAKFEGLLLAGWGAGILWFALYGDYWMLLNPKFKWLTVIGGVLVFCFGLTLLLLAKKAHHYSRIAVFVVLTLLAPDVLFKATDSQTLLASTASTVAALFHSSKDGKYPNLPVTELFMSISNPNQSPITTSFETMGLVKRLPTLDREGEFALMETFVFCCLADAVAVGIRVPWGQVSDLKDGGWVKVYGKLEKRTTPKPTPPFRLGPVNMSVVNDTYIIRPDKVVPTGPPEIPFYFRTGTN